MNVGNQFTPGLIEQLAKSCLIAMLSVNFTLKAVLVGGDQERKMGQELHRRKRGNLQKKKSLSYRKENLITCKNHPF